MTPPPTPPRRLDGHRLDAELIGALVAGQTWDRAAETAGCSRSTVARRCADPGFRERLEAERDRLVRSTTDRLASMSLQALDTLGELLEVAPPTTRERAAARVLELSLRFREQSDLERRLAAIEARQAALDTAAHRQRERPA